jgi:hypothetical protein
VRSYFILVVVFAVLATPAVANAQIVNVQNALAKPPEHDGVIGQLEAKLDWREGNNPLLDVGATASAIAKRGRMLGLAIARAEYGRGRDDTFKRRTFEHLRLRVTLDCRWKWEAFGQHELDRFRRLAVRALTGTGPALQVLVTQPVSILAGAAYMFEYERLDGRSGTLDAGNRTVFHRASVYLTGTERIGETAAVTQTFYVQPRLAEPGDLRLFGELSITTKISKHFALTDAFIVSYDSRPPDGIRRYDTQLRVALLLTL